MTLKLIKTLWGIDEPISKTLFDSIRQEGYVGVEVIRLAWMDPEVASTLVQALNDSNLILVCQIHTSGGFLRDGEYIYCDTYDVESHVTSFRNQLRECQDLILKVKAEGFVNVHAGVDAWTKEEALSFLQTCLEEIETTVSFPVVFETHRQRLFCNPFQTQELLQHNSLKHLKLNADLSHWYCACERVFDATQGRDAPWWPAVLELLQVHVHYIHARFGWAQGPQMADPSDEAHERDRALQLQVWERLLTAMKARDEDCLVCPEYGPPPYLPVLPHTQKPVASLADAVSYTKEYIEGLFEEFT